MVNNICNHSNQVESKKCFDLINSRCIQSRWFLSNQSKHAFSQERRTLSEFFQNLQIPVVREYGLVVADNFSDIVTGIDPSPSAFHRYQRKHLPNLWASVGWMPMYAKEDGRFQQSASAREALFTLKSLVRQALFN